ncbi:hypothetical protein KM043_012508 [Ampulex compressa]|nr:hypothetical protein KM043_012508 [Ampulex compressa]
MAVRKIPVGRGKGTKRSGWMYEDQAAQPSRLLPAADSLKAPSKRFLPGIPRVRGGCDVEGETNVVWDKLKVVEAAAASGVAVEQRRRPKETRNIGTNRVAFELTIVSILSSKQHRWSGPERRDVPGSGLEERRSQSVGGSFRIEPVGQSPAASS